MEQSLSWRKLKSFNDVEKFGILAGEEKGNKVFVGRAVDADGYYVPAKIFPALETSLYASDDSEVTRDVVDFPANASDFHWVKASDADIEDAAQVTDNVFIGRGTFDGNLIVGQVEGDKLVGCHDGKVIELPTYDVLIYKSTGVVYETIQKASNVSIQQENTEAKFLLQRIRQLETEKLSYVRDKQSYEERIGFEQRKVAELSQHLKKLRVENSRFSKERLSFEEKFTSEQRKFTSMDSKIREFALTNSYLLKKVTSLEEAIRFEKLMVESVAQKYANSETYSKTLVTKVISFEETIKTQQQRIFELESELMISSSSSESLLKRVSDYEETIKHLRIESETLVKKLEISSNDNEFLIQKLAMLTKTIRAYQNQIDCLNNKLQSSKTVIASIHADLSRANAQISKYQAALSSCYTLNGELMTRVSGLTAVAQNQVSSDCSLNLIDYSSSSFSHSTKFSSYNKTATLLELTGSDSYLGFADSPQPAQAYGGQQPTNGSFQVNGNGFPDNETAI